MFKILLLPIVCLLLSFSSFAQGKDAILIAAFGTSYKSALVSYQNIDRVIKKAFPEKVIRWSYTSAFIRKKLQKQGETFFSPEDVLEKLSREGFSSVVVQPIHVIPGYEFEEVQKAVRQYQGKFKLLKIGRPLIGNYDDAEKVATIVAKSVVREKDEDLILMGHGTHHYATLLYVAMDRLFKKNDPRIHMATVEGHPTFDEAIEAVSGKKKTALLPFMIVAGDHARNDMGGDDEDSWKSILGKKGIKARPIFKGLAEYDEIAGLFVTHILEATTL